VPNFKIYPLTDPAALTAKIEAAGGPKIDPTQTVGKATDCGVTLGWSVEALVGGDAGQITITILSKPWLIPASTIWSHVDAVFSS